MKKLVIIGNRIPEPTATAAGSRMLQLIDLFLGNGFKVTFLATNSKSEFSENLELLNVEVQFIGVNDNAFDALIKSLNPDFVVFDRFYTEEQFGWRVSEQCPNAVKILDTEDLHFLRLAREKCYLENRNIEFQDYVNETFVREIASIYRCDLSLIISEYEVDLLQETFNISRGLLYYLPFLVNSVQETVFNGFENRKNFIAIGNFLHQPNWHTVLELKKLWKLIKQKLPEATLEIYGAYMPQKAQELKNVKDGFLMKGKAASVAEIMKNARVLLAPIPYGAGLKGKLLESMQFGLPNVTTTIGAEGMNILYEWNGFIAENSLDFIEKAVDLYQNKLYWENSQDIGRKIIENKFLKTNFEANFILKIIDLKEELKTHRNINFLGKIFQQQSMQASKYMSKWITLKNQNLEENL